MSAKQIEPPSPPRVLYHYTSQVGLLGIVSQRRLRATNILYMNDSAEFHHGESIFDKLIKRKRKYARARQAEFFSAVDRLRSIIADRDFFVFSLTEAGDLLSQWRAYCPNANGFSIGFDTQHLRQIATHKGDWMLWPCIYDSKEQHAKAEQLLETCLRDWPNYKAAAFRFRLWLAYLASSFKNSAFRGEREWRLIGFWKEPKKMCFTNGRSMLIPYVELALKHNAKQHPIRSVTVGPCPHTELSRQSVLLLLKSQRIENASVQLSKVPYRGW